MAIVKLMGLALLSGAAVVALALPVLAQHEPIQNFPPNQTTVQQIPPAAPPEIMIEPQATEEGSAVPLSMDGCQKLQIVGQDMQTSLPAVYFAGAFSGIGNLVLEGVNYKLEFIKANPVPALPISSVQYPLSIDFIHRAQNGRIAVVRVPVKEGAANVGAEQMTMIPVGGDFDPNNLLPEKRNFVMIGRMLGDSCTNAQMSEEYMLINPIEMSQAQIKKLSRH